MTRSEKSEIFPFHRNVLQAATLCVSAQLPALGELVEAVVGLTEPQKKAESRSGLLHTAGERPYQWYFNQTRIP